MKSRNLFLGVLLLFVGVIALLATLDIFELRWSIVWHLWPMLLIFIGIIVLPVKDWLKVVMLLVSLVISVLLYRYEASQSWLQGLFSQLF
jgi:hypothetical protein